MSARDAAVLVFVWVAVQAGLAATVMLQFTVVTMLSDEATLPERVFGLVPIGFLVWVAFRLIRDRSRFAHAVFPDTVTGEPAATRRDLGVLGVAFIGLYVIVVAAPEFLTWVFELPAILQGGGGDDTGLSGAARFFSAVIDALAGVLLLVHREAIAAKLFSDSVPEETDAV